VVSKTPPAAKGGMDLTQLDDGDWVRVRRLDFGAGADSFNARVASGCGFVRGGGCGLISRFGSGADSSAGSASGAGCPTELVGR